MANILIIDDDKSLAELLKEYLQAEGLSVTIKHNLNSGLACCLSNSFDLLILDVMLPDGSGFDVIPKIREQQIIPILMLTARGDEVDRIVGLEIGADDYIAKPCSPRELHARIKALLRRANLSVAKEQIQNIELGDLQINYSCREVFCKQELVTLTGTEFNLLTELSKNLGKLLSKETLSQQVLGRRLSAFDRSIDMHVSNLRKKLHLGAFNLPDLKTIRGCGYILTAPVGGDHV